jgi:serine/threonine-protein kinase
MLLKFVVEESVNGRADRLKEYTIGAEALGKGESFDPRTDPIVRAEASRLRFRLERYYAAEGQTDPLVIALPKGGYAPQFLDRKIPSDEGHSSPVPPRAQLTYARFAWLAAGAVLAATFFGLIAWILNHPERAREERLIQFDVTLTSKGTVGGEVGTSAVLSPDGSRVVFVTVGQDGGSHLNTRRLDESKVTELPGTDGARVPFFSPDGRWVGFWASGKLKRTPVEGGSPVVLCDAPDLMGASWGEDGSIIASMGGPTLVRVPVSGGTPVVVLDLSKEAVLPGWPQVLPGGKFVLYTAIGFYGPNHANIEALSLATGKRSVLARGGTFGRYLPDSFVTYVNQGTLFALPVDLQKMEPRGSATPVLDGVSYSSTFGFAELDFSQTGTLVYRKNNGGQVTAQWLDRTGKSEPMLAKPGSYLWPRLSPNEKRLALAVTESGESGTWIYEGPPERFTRLPSPSGLHFPLWTPDGRYLVLGGVEELDWIAADGSGKLQPLTHSNRTQVPWSFTPDGTRLAYHELSQSNGFDLWTVPIHESAKGLTAGEPEPFLQTPAFETYPTFSPDGRWIAYGSNESGSWELYVRAFPENGRKVQVSTAGGRIAYWSPNGRELFYRTDDQRIMVASYAIEGGAFVVHANHQWSNRRLADTGVLSNFDLSSDGKRILALVPGPNPDVQGMENQATFMLNFFSEMERRVAASPQSSAGTH